jgi:spermidine/putrescine transport system ATP-binding protein
VSEVSRRFAGSLALDRISLTVQPGEFFSLLGPSGCGKTTLLRILGGLDLADQGEVRIGGVDAREIPAHRRPVNTVFQSYALFPHLTVGDNVAFGLRMKRVPRAEIAARVARALDLVEIAPFAGRKPAQLSGGQKQRVALARALVNEPQVLLLDEPLGALDLKLRKQLQVELSALQRRLGITFVYVTHDQEEALVMSDRIAVMRAGRLEQVGEAERLYERPATRFVAQFLGSCNLLEAAVVERAEGGAVVRTPLGPLRVEFGAAPPAAAARPSFTLAIRPEKVSLLALDGADAAGPTDAGGTAGATGAPAGENRVPVTVRELIYIGSETHYLLEAGDLTLTAYAMNSRVGHQGFDLGQRAVACLPPAGLVVLED